MPDEHTLSLPPLDRHCTDAATMVELTLRGLSPAPATSQVPRYPVWPVVIAPLVAGIYYIALRGAFAQSIGGVVFDASDIDLSDAAAPQWGSHWIYRTFAEIISLAFGTFIAAGIARQRAKAAALIGALAISLIYCLRTGAWLFIYFNNTAYEPIEPWPQHLVEVGVVIAAPLIGSAVSTLAVELNGLRTVGFAGINRLHFLWLWIAVSLYAAGIVAPVTTWLLSQFFDDLGENRIKAILHMIILGVPVLSFAAPAAVGLLVLSGETGFSRAAKNTVGPVILVIGWVIAACIQFYWAKLVGWVFG
jgi:hypothetical protein